MRILALVHRVPYPPNKGEKIRAYHAIQHLAGRGHAVDLATFADVEEDAHWRAQLLTMCRDVAVVRIDRRLSRARSVLALPRRRPLSVGYFDSFRLRRIVGDWLYERKYDVAFCYSSPMAEYVRERAQPKRMARVMDFVDIDSDKWAQYAEHTRQPMKALYRFEARSLAVYERRIAAEFDASTFVSAAEAQLFRRTAPDAKRIVDVPNGVDADYFGKTERAPRPASKPLFVFVGQMDYFANVDGVIHFAEAVFPRIRAALPQAEFRIVGRSPTAEVQRLASRPGVVITGAVPDVRVHLQEATLMVAPLRIARGVQNKVLEAMAARVPSVVSPQALEGIEARDGEELAVAEDPESFARVVCTLVQDEGRRKAMAERARALVASKYAWAPAMKKLEDLMLECVAEVTGR